MLIEITNEDNLIDTNVELMKIVLEMEFGEEYERYFPDWHDIYDMYSSWVFQNFGLPHSARPAYDMWYEW